MRKRLIIVLAISVLVVFSFSIASFAQNYGEAPQLGELVDSGQLPPVGDRLPQDPLVIDTWHEIGQYGGTWNRTTTSEDFIFTPLLMYGFSFTRYDDNLAVVPGLAKSWESNEDKSVWTVHFREGTKWSDGEPFTVDDIIFWWEEMALNEEHSDVPPQFLKVSGKVAQLEKIDDYTIRFHFAGPQPVFDFNMAMWTNAGLGARFIVPAHYLKQFHPDYSDSYSDYSEMEEKQDWWRNPDYPVLTAWKAAEYQAGKRLKLERNPYYYAVDEEGNQLPYIDEVDVRYAADMEVVKLKLTNGEIDMQIRPYMALMETSLLKQNEVKGDYTTYMWESGSGSGPLVYTNWNHPDSDKRELYRKPEFRQALSHAMDRDKIQKVLFLGMGRKTTGSFSPKTPEYSHFEEGQKVMEEWINSYVEYDPGKARDLLDELGVVDQNDDGWRELPNGEELKLRIDMDSGASTEYIDSSEMIKQDWREVGLKTIVNPMDGSKLGVMQTNAAFDIRDSWEWAGDHMYPHWLYPIGNGRWAPLYGAWHMMKGTPGANEGLEEDPRDRTPPRAKPPEGGPIARLQEIYDKMKVEADLETRRQLIYEATKIHIDEGPFIIGTVAEFPVPFVVKNNFHNVPERSELGNGGLVFPWHIPHPAITNPPQYFISESE